MENSENIFYGKLEKIVIHDIKGDYFDWIVKNPEFTLDKTREIKDGDILEVYDNFGKIILKKEIFRDTETFYNHIHKKQLLNGMKVSWIPKTIDAGFWNNLFDNRYNAKLTIK